MFTFSEINCRSPIHVWILNIYDILLIVFLNKQFITPFVFIHRAVQSLMHTRSMSEIHIKRILCGTAVTLATKRLFPITANDINLIEIHNKHILGYQTVTLFLVTIDTTRTNLKPQYSVSKTDIIILNTRYN